MKEIIDYKKREYAEKTIQELRTIGRDVGVKSPTSLSKENLIDEIISIFFGGEPTSLETRGRPAKKKDKNIIPYNYDTFDYKKEFKLDMKTYAAANTTDYKIEKNVELIKHYYYNLRGKEFLIDTEYRVIPIPAEIKAMIDRCGNVKIGDLLTFEKQKDGALTLKFINNCDFDSIKKRVNFDNLVFDEKLNKCIFNKLSPKVQILQKVLPFALGHRALFVGPINLDSFEAIIDYAEGIDGLQCAEIIPIFSLATKERVEEFEKRTKSKIVFYGKSEDAFSRYAIIKTLVEHAKRLIELGENVVLIVDDLVPIYNAIYYGSKSEGFNLDVLSLLRSYFSQGGSVKDGGSLTIICGVDNNTETGKLLYENLISLASFKLQFDLYLHSIGVIPSVNLANCICNLSNEKLKTNMKIKSVASQLFFENKEPEVLQKVYNILAEDKDDEEILSNLIDYKNNLLA